MAKVTATAKIPDTPEQKIAKKLREKFNKLVTDIDKLVVAHKKALQVIDERIDNINDAFNNIIDPVSK